MRLFFLSIRLPWDCGLRTSVCIVFLLRLLFQSKMFMHLCCPRHRLLIHQRDCRCRLQASLPQDFWLMATHLAEATAICATLAVPKRSVLALNSIPYAGAFKLPMQTILKSHCCPRVCQSDKQAEAKEAEAINMSFQHHAQAQCSQCIVRRPVEAVFLGV